MVIGYVDGAAVEFSAWDKMIRIVGTSVCLVGAATEQEAIALANKNLKDFTPFDLFVEEAGMLAEDIVADVLKIMGIESHNIGREISTEALDKMCKKVVRELGIAGLIPKPIVKALTGTEE